MYFLAFKIERCFIRKVEASLVLDPLNNLPRERERLGNLASALS
jgi:hypothetical protein